MVGYQEERTLSTSPLHGLFYFIAPCLTFYVQSNWEDRQTMLSTPSSRLITARYNLASLTHTSRALSHAQFQHSPIVCSTYNPATANGKVEQRAEEKGRKGEIENETELSSRPMQATIIAVCDIDSRKQTSSSSGSRLYEETLPTDCLQAL